MAKNKETNFDEDLFRKRIRLADSDMGDGAVAFTQAKVQCHERTPPLLLHEAVVKYMGPSRPSMDEVEEENIRLEEENQAIRAENDWLKQEVASLNAKQREEDSMDEEHHFSELVDRVYGTPEGRIVVMMILIAARIGIYWKWETTPSFGWFWTINVVFLPLAIVVLDWIKLQFKRSGLVIFLLRASFIFIGLLEAYRLLFVRLPWEVGTPIAEIPSRAVVSVEWAFAVLALTTLVACSKAARFMRNAFVYVVLPLKPVQAIKEMF